MFVVRSVLLFAVGLLNFHFKQQEVRICNCWIGSVVKNFAIGAGSEGFDALVCQIGRSHVRQGLATDAAFLETMLPRRLEAEMGPATRYTLWRNT